MTETKAYAEKIAVLVALRDGGKVQRRVSGRTGPEPPGEWLDCHDITQPFFSGPWEYRVKDVENSEVKPNGRK